eukprot:2893938-Pyramimonas_sp.AAC.1
MSQLMMEPMSTEPASKSSSLSFAVSTLGTTFESAASFWTASLYTLSVSCNSLRTRLTFSFCS